MDVVYKLGHGSKSDDKELRYSLRSLSNFEDLDKVFVVGFKPRWLQNVIHIPAVDAHPANKDCNLINKLILACYHPEISEDFVNMSDDQIFLKEVSKEELMQPYYDNSLLNCGENGRLSRWKKRLHNTIDALKNNNLPCNCYETHIPTVLNKILFPTTMEKFNYFDVPGMCGNTLFLNSIKYQIGREIDKNIAVKIEEAQTNIESIEKLCEGRIHLNYSEVATNDQLFEFLQKKFPVQSKYEIF